MLSARFPSAKHRFPSTGHARLPKGETRKERKREREREREKDPTFGAVGKSVCPALVCWCFAVTLSAQHCTSLIHCTVCPVSTVLPALPALVCRSLGSCDFPVQVCHLASPLPSQVFSNCLYSFWPSSGPSGAGRALLQLTAPPQVELKNFRSRNFSLVPLAQGYRCVVAVFLPFGRAISLFLTHFGVPKAKSLVLWSLELRRVLCLQNYERTP